LWLSAATLAASIVGAAALISYYSIFRPTTNPGQRTRPSVGRLAAPLVRTSKLPDGSTIDLAPQTSVDVTYTPTERLLKMQGGEAHFTVAPNKARPFIVSVNELRVRAVGTQFDIRQAGSRVVVSVIEGKIDIYRDKQYNSSKGETAPYAEGGVSHVAAGQQYTSPGSAGAAELAAIGVNQTLAWREGRLQYVGEPLGSVIADVNRYIDRPIVIRDDKLEALSYTGTIFTQSIDEWLNGMPKEFPLVVTMEADRIVLAARSTSDPRGL
jgi:transmembrane sensor